MTSEAPVTLARWNRAVRLNNLLWVAFGAMMLFIATYAQVTDARPDPDALFQNNYVIGLIGSVSLTYGLYAMVRDPRIVVVRDRPEQIVWFFARRYIRGNGHLHSYITLHLSTGKVLVTLVRAKNEAPMLDFIARIAPRAHSGYSAEAQAQFDRDPNGLRA